LPNVSALDPGRSPLHTFGAELRCKRQIRGFTLNDLGRKLHCTASLIGQIETGRKFPQWQFAEGADRELRTDGIFERLMPLVTQSMLPGWFQTYADLEAEACHIYTWGPQVVHGLLQTEEYATAMLSRRFRENTPEKVKARLERQQALQREKPPLFWAVLHESVLHTEIGGAEVMRRQLHHLLNFVESASVNLQVLPFSAGAHTGLNGAFTTLRFEKHHDDLLYLDGYEQGSMTVNPETVKTHALRYDHLQAEALSVRASAGMIRYVLEDRYGNHR
jgi:transcriptional regulator with XRE-family HTH domain